MTKVDKKMDEKIHWQQWSKMVKLMWFCWLENFSQLG